MVCRLGPRLFIASRWPLLIWLLPKGSLNLLLVRDWYMHPNGQLPAYEWDFSDANPPVHGYGYLEDLPVR
jgi:hypothetical protein